MSHSKTLTISWRCLVFFGQLGAFFHVTIVRQFLQIDEACEEGFVQVRKDDSGWCDLVEVKKGTCSTGFQADVDGLHTVQITREPRMQGNAQTRSILVRMSALL